MKIGGCKVGGGTLLIEEKEDSRVETKREECYERDKGKAKANEIQKPSFKPILSFFEVLQLNYQGQRLDKIVELEQFKLKEKTHIGMLIFDSRGW